MPLKLFSKMSSDGERIWASAPPSPREKPDEVALPEELPGTVFLISSSGKIHKLPIPSESRRDPLTWSRARRNAAFSAIVFNTIVCFYQNKLPAALMGAFHLEFDPKVLSHNRKPFLAWPLTR